ncbi:MAG TPA: hypothetical protein VFV38_02400 [Ktedonobacteraceae bacterium]|nr:hypothetical protein [Ktedonobacteraceae bacterium]
MTLIASVSTQVILDGAATTATFKRYVEQLLAPGLRPMTSREIFPCCAKRQ